MPCHAPPHPSFPLQAPPVDLDALGSELGAAEAALEEQASIVQVGEVGFGIFVTVLEAVGEESASGGRALEEKASKGGQGGWVRQSCAQERMISRSTCSQGHLPTPLFNPGAVQGPAHSEAAGGGSGVQHGGRRQHPAG